MMYRVQNEGAAWGSITFLNKAMVLKGELLHTQAIGFSSGAPWQQ